MISSDSFTFVLVHGSWHDGSAWSEVAAYLQNHGHRVHAPTLAGHGADADKNVGLNEIVDSLEKYVTENHVSNFILVGHSFAGAVLQAIAERMPDRIRQLVFANAYVLRDGERFQDVLPEGVADMLADSVQDDGGIPISFDLFRQLFCDGTDADARRVHATLSPAPRRCWTDRISLPTFFSLPIPKAFIYFTDDGGPTGDKDPAYHFCPRHIARLGEHQFLQMPGGHEVMYTDPEGLAMSLMTVAA